jgi:hypothetical protein
MKTLSAPSNTLSYHASALRLRQLNVCGSNTTISRRSGKCRVIAAMALRALS